MRDVSSEERLVLYWSMSEVKFKGLQEELLLVSPFFSAPCSYFNMPGWCWWFAKAAVFIECLSLEVWFITVLTFLILFLFLNTSMYWRCLMRWEWFFSSTLISEFILSYSDCNSKESFVCTYLFDPFMKSLTLVESKLDLLSCSPSTLN